MTRCGREAMPVGAPFFLRHTPADPLAHQQRIEAARASLEAARAAADRLAVLDHAGTLGALLAIRQALDDPLQASSRRALAELARWQHGPGD